MKPLCTFSFLSSLALAAACGSASGVDSSKYIDELTAAEVTTLCEYRTDAIGTSSTTCGALTLQGVTQSKCETDARPHCLVSSLEGCVDSLAGDPCNFFKTAECATHLMCAAGSDS
jgi:hypothetical protein